MQEAVAEAAVLGAAAAPGAGDHTDTGQHSSDEDEGGDDVARLGFDAEMVVEHEHEQEVQAEAVATPAFGRDDEGKLAASWHVADLFMRRSHTTGGSSDSQVCDNRAGVFRPLSCVQLASTKHSSARSPAARVC